jgi:hypothetical protein
VYRRSLSSDPENPKAEAFKYSEIRKDSAVHVSLSSSLLVKQPGIRKPLSLYREPSVRNLPRKLSNTLTGRRMTTGYYRLLNHSSQ